MRTMRNTIFFLTATATILLLYTGVALAQAASGVNEKIVFDDFHDGVTTINPDGTARERIAFNAMSPAYSSDGTKLAVSCSGSTGNICLMNSDGSGKTNLTSNTTEEDFPAWSPDDKKLIFTRYIDSNPENLDALSGEIYKVNADGSGQVLLTAGQGIKDGYSASNPDWSPDGTKIVWESTLLDYRKEIVMMNANGSGKVRIAAGGNPAWSPNGTKIAYERGCDIWMMDANGGGQISITSDTGAKCARDPAWSPDGTKIVFSLADDIWVMRSDGSGKPTSPILHERSKAVRIGERHQTPPLPEARSRSTVVKPTPRAPRSSSPSPRLTPAPA